MRLTIVIPVYNTEKFVGRAIESVSHFENINYEILCVNDGSTDNSLAVLKDYSGKLNNLRVISQENQGLSGARNTGIKNAKGKFILFLDADDWLSVSNNYFFEIFNYISKRRIDVYGYRLQFIDAGSGKIIKSTKHPLTYKKTSSGSNFLIEGYQPSSCCLFIISKNLILENDLWFFPKISQQDVEFTVRLMLKADRVYFSDDVIYNYFRMMGSISKPQSTEAIKKNFTDAIIVAKEIRLNIQSQEDPLIKKAIIKNYNNVVWNLLWRFLKRPREVDNRFKECILKQLKSENLYPIKGSLKTPFQNLIRIFFNNQLFVKYVLNKL